MQVCVRETAVPCAGASLRSDVPAARPNCGSDNQGSRGPATRDRPKRDEVAGDG